MRTRALALLLALALTASPAWAARQFNGTNQCLNSASSINLTAYSKLAVAFWLYWDAFANDDKTAAELGNGATSGDFGVIPNESSSGGNWADYDFGNVGAAGSAWTRPSAGTWHHIVVNLDFAAAGASEDVDLYIDGSRAAFIGGAFTNDNASGTTFANATLYLMSRGCASRWGAGRQAEVAIWGGINFSSTDVSNLYNGGSGALATSVQGGSLVYYWKLCGTASPEPNTVGGVDLTVTGATSVTHPISTCAAAAPAACVLGGGIVRPQCPG